MAPKGLRYGLNDCRVSPTSTGFRSRGNIGTLATEKM